LERPIVSLRWRRVTFIHTTWDRFQDAREINDLFVEGEPYVDRRYAILRDQEGEEQRDRGAEESRERETKRLGIERLETENKGVENRQFAVGNPQSADETSQFTIDDGEP
jgi:hypothetical protein